MAELKGSKDNHSKKSTDAEENTLRLRNDYEAQIRTLKKEYTTRIKVLENDYNSQIADLQWELKSVTKNLKGDASNNKEELESRISTIRRENKETIKKLIRDGQETQQQLTNDHNRQITDLETKLKDARNELVNSKQSGTIDRDKRSLELQNAIKEGEERVLSVERLRNAEIEKLRDENGRLNSEIDSRDDTIRNIKGTVRNLETQLRSQKGDHEDSLNQMKNRHTRVVEDLKREITTRDKEIHVLYDRIKAEQNKLSNESSKRNDMLEDARRDSMLASRSFQQKFREEIKNLETTIKLKDVKLNDLTDQLNLATQRENELRDQLDKESQKWTRNNKRSTDESQSRIEALTAEIAKLRANLQRAEDKASRSDSERRAAQEKADDLAAKVKKLEADLASVQRDLNNRIVTLKSEHITEINTIKKQNTLRETQADQKHRDRVKDLEYKTQALQKKLTGEASDNIDDLESRIKQIRRTYDTQIQKLTSDYDLTIKQQKIDLERRIADLEAQLRSRDKEHEMRAMVDRKEIDRLTRSSKESENQTIEEHAASRGRYELEISRLKDQIKLLDNDVKDGEKTRAELMDRLKEQGRTMRGMVNDGERSLNREKYETSKISREGQDRIKMLENNIKTLETKVITQTRIIEKTKLERDAADRNARNATNKLRSTEGDGRNKKPI
eukprot:TRINITY_DN222_c0_g1_i1.p1 TRINITY_DN222_c0_g1~~TRINITY_DN222_c0_g1_i1.p1  ORF type:complete len:675 (-),score=168.83 TRINITY_DN222_c0_g1_i1:547-2571(-)